MSTTLNGQIAIVTGGSKGFGMGIAAALKNAGAEVWITGRNAASLHSTAHHLGVHSFVADATKGRDWDALIAAVTARSGRLDILVNNAGGGVKIAPVDEQSDESIEAAIALNLTSAILGSARAAKVMKKQKSGTIINVSSICERYVWPGWTVYSAAKAGLEMMGRGLYTELRPFGVRVTTLTPSWGATDFMTAAHISGHPASEAAVRAKCIQPADLGRVVVDVCTMPSHLAVTHLQVMPLVQDFSPM